MCADIISAVQQGISRASVSKVAVMKQYKDRLFALRLLCTDADI